MNQHHKAILDFIESKSHFSEDDRETLKNLLTVADKALTIAEFKLERTEKVKRTTAILLEETIEELEQKRKAIEESNQALEKSLSELKSAQAQLIQSEKMASLGELTAGIAHEIQNPLNFVNNFSEVSSELIEDIDEELEEGEIDEVKAILKDIKENLLKINHHGKRADSIVKGMLQHSRNSSGEKEPTDINQLVEEYLNLAYHGLRAKDKGFSSNIETDFDKSIGKISIVPSDIGRVILNLINNAFYAVNEKKKENTEGYQPKVEIITENHEQNVLIKVIDNGNGIPNSVVDKIFQPFFTTKPTGQGTGLGLSMSYDIIKAHGGELNVRTEEGVGSELT
ncbi:MAG: ATP-binding protein, partial [Flavobacteriaceae bacterium]|nr:ATP-binding protein [Flavobacteriaceae bacterium]